MAKKGGMPIYETVDDYISNQPLASQVILKELRNIINETVPKAIELPNYKVPTFELVPGTSKDYQLMIAGYKKYVSFYPFPTTITAFEDELKSYKTGKGSVQFPIGEPLPVELIKSMVAFRYKEIQDA